MTAASQDTRITPCVRFSNVFLHPLLEGRQTANSRDHRREQAMLQAQAATLCSECPFMERCLTDAITKFDVSGFVAGTTRRQRTEIRSRLGINVNEDDLDSYVGVSSGRQFDSEEIHRLRAANPDEPLTSIAARVGCSVSTVKRHLRRVATEGVPVTTKRKPPSADKVLAVAREVKQGSSRRVA
ncbi:MAG: helix-turn-helix domain-containing protein [Arachnia sp.]